MNVRDRNNMRILGADTEDVPTLVLAHGFGCDQTMWRLVAAPLSERYRVVLFDHVGSGGSDPSAWDAGRYSKLDGYALDIVDDLGTGGVVFVGHSVAAMMGVVAAGLRPGVFAQLGLVAPSPRYIDDGDYRGGFSRADIDDLLESLDSNYLGRPTGRNSPMNSPRVSVAPIRPARGCSRAPRSCPTIARTSPGSRCPPWFWNAHRTRSRPPGSARTSRTGYPTAGW